MQASELVSMLNQRFPFDPAYLAFVVSVDNRAAFTDPMSDHFPRYFNVVAQDGVFTVEWADDRLNERSFNGFDDLCNFINLRWMRR